MIDRRKARRGLAAWLMSCAWAVCAATPAWRVHISEQDDKHLRLRVERLCAAEASCPAQALPEFPAALGLKEIGPGQFERRLTSAIEGDHHYMVAGRQGRAIYLYLPAFCPLVGCEAVNLVLEAERVLDGDRVHAERLELRGSQVKSRAVLLGHDGDFSDAVHIDPAFGDAAAARLRASMLALAAFHRREFGVDVLAGLGIVASISRHDGGYMGSGGDALNIIRLAIDNPLPDQDPRQMADTLVKVFAHEIAHKLQSERLFELPAARFVVEGGAEFLAWISLRETGILDAEASRAREQTAAQACRDMALAVPLTARMREGGVQFREPYDCGLSFYLASWRASGLSWRAFLRRWQSAMQGEDTPEGRASCLWFESPCAIAEAQAWLQLPAASKPARESGADHH